MQAAITAGAGFLVAVLWFDLMFDVQVLAHRDAEIPETVLASIAAYYRRVTTDARPMNRLIAATMLATIAAVIAQLVRDDARLWVSVVSLVTIASAVGLAASRTVRNAVRLGGRTDSLDQQRTLARSVCRDHVVCLTLVATALVVQLGWA